ncbi:hypothetical protein Bca52824_085295 [Brassica carinata]|uniref:Acyl-CoA-binding domain-containing protein n=1 Tax=Brassica carinata TaxID=52824 RepID=A0A8X7P7Y7_BRACI|nr:hypothetical protein Bca52824_085295 [Brassica carinata]
MSTLSWSVIASVEGCVPLASEGLSLVVSSYNGEDVLVAFGGYNGRYNNEINLLKPSHKSALQPKTLEPPLPGSLSAVNNATTRDIESEVEVNQESRVREIAMDNANAGSKVEVNSEHIFAILKSEKEELEASLNKEQMQTLQLRQELAEGESRNTDLNKVDVAELRQKLQTLETLQKELELLQRQRLPLNKHQRTLNVRAPVVSGAGSLEALRRRMMIRHNLFHVEASQSQSGKTLVIFGGQDAKRSLLNDLHVLDLETMTWDEIDAIGASPSPRSDHAAAVHAERYLLIFGGGSHATCFGDLHVLDLQTMEWSRPAQQGDTPTPRSGHAGVTIGENWFIVGGGDNKSGASESIVLNMSTLTWSVVASVEGRVPLASEGLSLVVSSYNGEDVLVAFGGYNGRYNNEINLLKPSHKSALQPKTLEPPLPVSLSAVDNATTRDIESEVEVNQESRVREIAMDNANAGSKVEVNNEHIIATLKSEKEELEASLNKEKLQTQQLRQELAEGESRNTDLNKVIVIFSPSLKTEQSRCFKLEVDVAELRQKLQTLETLQKELELLQRQKAASEQTATNAKRQSSGGVWGWLAGSPQEKDDSP